MHTVTPSGRGSRILQFQHSHVNSRANVERPSAVPPCDHPRARETWPCGGGGRRRQAAAGGGRRRQVVAGCRRQAAGGGNHLALEHKGPPWWRDRGSRRARRRTARKRVICLSLPAGRRRQSVRIVRIPACRRHRRQGRDRSAVQCAEKRCHRLLRRCDARRRRRRRRQGWRRPLDSLPLRSPVRSGTRVQVCGCLELLRLGMRLDWCRRLRSLGRGLLRTGSRRRRRRRRRPRRRRPRRRLAASRRTLPRLLLDRSG